MDDNSDLGLIRDTGMAGGVDIPDLGAGNTANGDKGGEDGGWFIISDDPSKSPVR